MIWVFRIIILVLAPIILYWQYKDVRDLFASIETLYENQIVITHSQLVLTEEIKELRSGAPALVPPLAPIVKPTPLQVVRTDHQLKHDPLDLFCMAKNIYHEAAHEPEIGRYAVAQITLNRKMNPRYPKKICDVIMDPYQFSWANDKKIRWTNPKGPAWEESKRIAYNVVVEGYRVKGLEHGLFYHADYVSPRWRDNNAQIIQVGRHIFYSRAL
jgi:N-acetylmuramoyl-L-alanine amidase